MSLTDAALLTVCPAGATILQVQAVQCEVN